VQPAAAIRLAKDSQGRSRRLYVWAHIIDVGHKSLEAQREDLKRDYGFVDLLRFSDVFVGALPIRSSVCERTGPSTPLLGRPLRTFPYRGCRIRSRRAARKAAFARLTGR